MRSEAAPVQDLCGICWHRATFSPEQEVTLIKACIQFSVGAREPKQRSSNATASLGSVHLAPTKLVPERGHCHRHLMSCHIIMCATEGQVGPAAQKAVALLWHFSNPSPHSVCTGHLCNQKTKIWSMIAKVSYSTVCKNSSLGMSDMKFSGGLTLCSLVGGY
jgi:hypothetical protein